MFRSHWGIPLFVIGFGVSLVAQTATRDLVTDVLNKKTKQPITGISTSSFEIKLDGKPLRVVEVKRSAIRRNVSILLDTSGSMSDLKRWQTAFTIAATSLEQLAPQANVTLVVMGDKYTKVIDNRHGVDAMIDQLEALFKHANKRVGTGKTQLYDALQTASTYGPLAAGDSLVVITDGGDNASHISADRVKRFMRAKEIRLFAALLELDSPATPEESTGPAELEAIARATGGRIEAIRCCADDVKISIQSIFGSVLHPLVMTVEVPAGATGKLTVRYVGENAKEAVVSSPAQLTLTNPVIAPTGK